MSQNLVASVSGIPLHTELQQITRLLQSEFERHENALAEIEHQEKNSLLWIRDVVKLDLHLSEKMLNDVYIEQLGHGRFVHTIVLPQVQLLRWMMLKFDRFSASSRDPLQPYVTGQHGIVPNGTCKNANDFLARPDSYPDVGINFTLNYRYFKI